MKEYAYARDVKRADWISHRSDGTIWQMLSRRVDGTKMILSKSILIVFSAILAAMPIAVQDIRAMPQNVPPTTGAQSAKGEGGVPVRLPNGKKLVLADGTFQMVREYSIEGDRVRYWSVERSDWEEIPSKLIDWDATHRAEADQARQDEELKAKIRASELIERTQNIDTDRSVEIKPGLFLPDGVGLYLVEDKLIFSLKQSETVTKLDRGRAVERILSGVPIIPSKQNLFITGPRSALRLTTAEPEFYMRPADSREPRFRLLRTEIKGGNRVVDSISIHMSGEQIHKTNEIEFQTWTPARGVFRYTLNQRLEPGEYVFVEMTADGINGYVWDFGVDGTASKSGKK
jgi:hypothetical protein